MRDQRKKAAHRRRRIICADDGSGIAYFLKAATPEAFLADRMDRLVGTHVDTVVYTTWGTGLGQFTHMTDVAEPWYDTSGPFENNLTKAFHDQGLDPLQIMIDFCRSNGMELFWGLRMNDIHDSEPQWAAMLSRWKHDNPHLLFGTRDNPPEFGTWSGLDYGQPEVRERAFQLVEEVCTRYDVDGIELDFLRHPPFFRCNTRGEDCSDEEREIMSGLLLRIREMTDAAGRARGRPILIGARVPATLPGCEALGLDITAWLERDLVDLLFPAEWEFSPWAQWVELGHYHDVPVYPCLSWVGSKKRRAPPGTEADDVRTGSARSRAMNVWHAGADGVYLFNFYDPPPPRDCIWSEAGDPALLAHLDKDYFPHGYWRVLLNNEFHDMERVIEVPLPPYPDRPVRIEPGDTHHVTILVGEDPSGAGEVTLSLAIDTDTIAATVNDHPLANGKANGDWITYEPPAAWIHPGANRVSLTNPSGAGKSAILRDVHLRIHY